MKIKRFNNLWTMGLILTGAILVLFYIAKIFFPELIISIAETPRVVKFGNFVQSNKWRFQAFNFVSGYIHGYILCCACCRSYKLNWKSNIILFLISLILILVSEFYPMQYTSLNCASMVIAPFLMCLANKKLSKETFTSTIVCFSLELLFEFLSLVIRNLLVMTKQQNVATMCILMIDLFIWRVILYLFFNNKNKIKGEQ